MAKKGTLTEAFAHFGAVPKNPRWSWSARSADGETVVITLWKDRISGHKQGRIEYNEGSHGDVVKWMSRPGNRERLDNLLWAQDHCGGLFRVIIAVAKDVTASPREIADCYPQSKLNMRILSLDEETGIFHAVQSDADKKREEK